MTGPAGSAGSGGSGGSGGSRADDAAALAGLRDLLAASVTRLTEADARHEARAVVTVPRRILGIERAAILKPAGRVWRLGVVLLDADGRLYATGAIVRAVPPGHPGHVSQLAEQRKAERAAALKAGYPDGETVNFEAPEIVLDAAVLRAADGPVVLRDEGVLVRWSPASGAGLMPLASYLRERVELLADPPQGAN